MLLLVQALAVPSFAQLGFRRESGSRPSITVKAVSQCVQDPYVFALIRQILTVAGTALVAKGLVQASDLEPVIGALLTIGSVVWSVADKRGR